MVAKNGGLCYNVTVHKDAEILLFIEEKIMKKILSVLMAFVMVLSLGALFIACDKATNTEETTTAADTTAAETTTAADEESTEKATLKMGTNAYFQP